MDVLASIMFYLQEYDYVFFPIVVAILAAISFKSDKRSALILWSLAVVYTVDAVLGSKVFYDVSMFYKFNVVINSLVFMVLMLQKQLWKKLITGIMCILIVAMNLHEHYSPYQTFMYLYIDSIHSWYLEALTLIVLINFKASTKL